MLYFKLAGAVLIHLLLLPIKFIISLVVRFCWYPNYKVDFSIFKNNGDSKIEIEPFDVNKWLYDGDGLKFIGMYYYTTGKCWVDLLSFIDDDGNLYRTPRHEDMEVMPVVSGDMIVGLLLACVRRLDNNEEIPDKVKKVFYNILEEGWPLKINHPYKRDFSRGFVFTPWEPVYGAALSSSAFCDVAYAVTGDVKFKVVERIIRWSNFPLSFNSDYSFWIGKFSFKTWYIEHSKALLALAGWSVSGKSHHYYCYKKYVERLAKRYYYNVDVVSIAAVINEWGEDNKLVKDILTTYGNLLYAPDCIFSSKIKTYSLRSFKWKEQYEYVLPPSCRKGQKYMWETTPLRHDPAQQYSELDIVFSTALLHKINVNNKNK